MRRLKQRISVLSIGVCMAVILSGATSARQEKPGSSAAGDPNAVFDKYCISCHSQKLHTAGVDLEHLDLSNPSHNAELLERVIAKLRAGSMPPQGNPRPDPATYRTV